MPVVWLSKFQNTVMTAGQSGTAESPHLLALSSGESELYAASDSAKPGFGGARASGQSVSADVLFNIFRTHPIETKPLRIYVAFGTWIWEPALKTPGAEARANAGGSKCGLE